jgi:hypothetical protein
LNTWFNISRTGCPLGSAVDIVKERPSISLIGGLGGILSCKAKLVSELDLRLDLSVGTVDPVSERMSLVSTRLVTIRLNWTGIGIR